MVYLEEIFLKKQVLQQEIIVEYAPSLHSEREISGDLNIY